MKNFFSALKMNLFLLLALSVIAACGTGGLADPPAGSSAGGTTSGTTTGTTGKGSITFAIVKSSDPNTATTSISPNSPAVVKASAKDGTGAVLAGKVMSFSSKFDIKFSPVSGTALTDASGTAAITVMVGATAGAATISASVSDNAGTVITNDTGITVNLQAPPAVPTIVTATATSSSQIGLAWTASAGATSYNIFKGGKLLGAVTSTELVDGGLTASTQYCYSVSATDRSGNASDQSSTVCATTGIATPPVTSEPAGVLNLLTSSPQVGSDGMSTVTLTAIVKTAKNVTLKDKLVTFESNSGTLVVTRGTTDASGSAAATLSAAADKSKRTITVTAKADSITSTTSVDVVGTTLQITGQNSLVSGTSARLSIFLKDSAGATIPGQRIALTSSLGNRFDQNPVSTGANGQAEVTYTATVGGTDTVTASALGAIATQTINVSTTDFAFTAPSSGAEVDIGGPPQTVTIRYALSGVPQTGKTVNFSTTRGTITPLSVVTNGSGNASAALSSSTAGPATIVATITGAGAIQTPVEFIATSASSISLQASPSTISTNTAGSAVEQSTIIAVIRDSSGNLVKNKTVRFSLTDVSGGYIKQASDVTNSQGMASTTYISSISPTVKNGVTIYASVEGLATTAAAMLTVASKPIYVVFGTGNTIENYSSTQYRVPFVALVTDIAGNPQAGVTVTANLTPVTYLKGRYDSSGCPASVHWYWIPALASDNTYLECVNEDNNPIFLGSHPEWLLNGVLNKEAAPSSVTEDINGDGVLTPGNVAEVSRTATTDANGFAQFYVIYAKQFANWVKVRIEGRIYSYGDQTLGTTQFYLPVLRDDVLCTTTPPGPISPFGLGAPPNNVCTYVKASEARAPGGVTVTAVSPTQIQISWDDAGAAAYRIYKDGVFFQDSVTRSIISRNLSANTTYCYAVSSIDSAGLESSKSGTVCATTDLAVPAAPSGLTATARSSTQVDLAWIAPPGGARGYNVYRNRLNSQGVYVGWVLLGSVEGTTVSDMAGAWNSSSFPDIQDGYPPNEDPPSTHTQYCYSITAWNDPGNPSPATSAVCMATP